MDENLTEENEISTAASYAKLLTATFAIGAVIGIGVTTGAELSMRAIEKIDTLRKARAKKKSDQEK